MQIEIIHYVIAVVFILALPFLLVGRRKTTQHKKRKIAKKVNATIKQIENAPQVMAYLKKIDPFAFEELLLDSFNRRGLSVIRNKRYTGDGGVDGRVVINGHTFLIQAKRYQAHITPSHVEALNDLCEKEDTYGLFVHTGITGPMSKAYHHDRIGMISGEALIKFLKTDDTLTILLNRKHYIQI